MSKNKWLIMNDKKSFWSGPKKDRGLLTTWVDLKDAYRMQTWEEARDFSSALWARADPNVLTNLFFGAIHEEEIEQTFKIWWGLKQKGQLYT